MVSDEFIQDNRDITVSVGDEDDGASTATSTQSDRLSFADDDGYDRISNARVDDDSGGTRGDTSAGRDSPGGIDSPEFDGGDDGRVGPEPEPDDTSAGRDSPGGIDSPEFGGGDDGRVGPAPEPEPEPDPITGSTSIDDAVSGGREVISASVDDQDITPRQRDLFRGSGDTIDTGDTGGETTASAPARALDRFTDGFAQQNPAVTGAITTTAASLRTQTGLPLPGTDRTLPGRRDVRDFRETFEGPADDIDEGISDAVGGVSVGDSGPIDPDDLPSLDPEMALRLTRRNPATGAAAAAIGTEAGRRGTSAGIAQGLQTFNPAAAISDSAQFADVGVRGADRLLRADAEEIDTAAETGEETAETAADVAPEAAAAAVARDPSTIFRAPTAAFTTGIVGTAGPTGAVRGGRRVAGAANRARRGADDFIGDTRGQADGSGLFRRGSDDVETDSSTDLMDELGDELDRMETGTAIRRGRDRAERRTLDRRLEEATRQERGRDPTTVSRPEASTVSRPESRTVSRGPATSRSGPTSAQRSTGRFRSLDTDLSPRESQLAAQLGRETPATDLRSILSGRTPPDPLDSSGATIGAAEATGLSVGGAGAIGGQLDAESATDTGGLFDDATTPAVDGGGVGSGDIDGIIGGVGSRTTDGPGTDDVTVEDVDVGPATDTDTATDTNTATGSRGRTATGTRTTTTALPMRDLDIGLRAAPDREVTPTERDEPVSGGVTDAPPSFRRPPDVEVDTDFEEDEEPLVGFGAADATFLSSTRTLGEADEIVIETAEFDRLGEDLNGPP